MAHVVRQQETESQGHTNRLGAEQTYYFPSVVLYTLRIARHSVATE